MTMGTRKMKRQISPLFRSLHRDENGAVAVLVAMLIVAILGLGALAVDIGNLAYAQRRLQETTDMAALAGALQLSCSNVVSGTHCTSGAEITAAETYSAMSAYSGKNVQAGLTVTSMTAQGKCLTNFGANNNVYYNASTGECTGLDGYNAVEVQQKATVPFLLGQIFGFGSVTLTATSLAGAKGSSGFPPLNVMIVLDTTGSMNDADPNGSVATCGVKNPTRLQCATFGVRLLLAELAPTQDQVGLMVFPQVSTGTASDDYSCNNNPQPTIEPYSATTGATYQVVSVTSSYRTSNSATTLNGSSQLSNAAQYGPSGAPCAGVKAVGGEGTYYAGAITAAQNALIASNSTGVCATQKCKNVIIFLSDGGAGNASTLWQSTTTQATAAGGITLTMAAAIPSYVVPGTSVADTTISSAIPAGTQVVSTSGSTVTLSSAVTSAATATTNAATPPNSTTLHFASVPSAVTTGMAVTDQTHPTAIAACTTVVSKSATTVTLSNAVTGTTVTTDITSAATTTPSAVLTFASVPTTTIAVGMGVTDTTNSSAIPSGSTVVSFTGTTVTISNPVGVTVTDTARTTNNSSTLSLSSPLTATVTGMTVTGTGIPANTTVVSGAVGSTSVSLSTKVTVKSGVTVTFSGDNVAKGDTITFSNDVESGDSIVFGGVGCGDTIAFGTNNQCHEAITAAQDAAAAGTWVYSIAYGSSTALSPNSNSCSDVETPPISSCTTMQDIASDSSKFYSDGSGGSGSCISQNNASDLGSIFQQIGNSLVYAAILPVGTN
jgi:Flp pilus assembly protein TadG